MRGQAFFLRWRRCLAVGLLAIAASGVAGADEDLFFSNLPVVASVSRLQQPLAEAPGAVTVIDRDLIRAAGARNIADVLRLVPGFSVTPPNQEAAVVAYHGLSNEEYTPRVQVLVDGRSLYSPLFKSGVNWNLVPVAPEDIERIEVMRGSNAVSYGSNAFLGVINIITQHASTASGFTLAASRGNQSIADQTVRWGGQVAGAHLRMTYRQQGDDGLRNMFDGNLGWFDPHDSRHNRLFDLRADVPLGDRDELQLSLSHAYDVSQFGRPLSTSDPFRDLSQSSTNLSAEWRRTLSPDEDFRLRFSHVEDWMSGRFIGRVSFTKPDDSSAAFNAVSPNDGRSVSNEIEWQHSFSPWRSTRLAWGANVSHVDLVSQQQFNSAAWQSRSVGRLFANLEWRPAAAWLLNFGAGLERDSLSGTHFDPRVGVSYHLLPGHTLRLIASRAHRTPSLFEARGDTQVGPVGGGGPLDRSYLAAPGLKAERLDTVEAGYLGEFKALRASLDVRAFNERIPNRITIVPYPLPAGAPDDRDSLGDRLVLTTALYPFGRADAALNLEKVSIRGYESQWRWQPFDATRILYGHAYTSIYADLTDVWAIADGNKGGGINIDKISTQTRDSAPRHATSVMLIQSLPYGFETSVMYYKSAFMRWRRNSFTAPYERVDWRLAKSFRLGPTRGEIAYTAQSANHPQDGRRETRVVNEMHWLSLRLDF